MELLSDNALMLQVKAGDLEKMGLLFQRYHQPLYGFLYRMTRQKECSEDMVQNVFFKLLKYRGSFTGKGEFRAWMYHVARNVLIDHLRKQKRTGNHYPVSDMGEKAVNHELPDQLVESKQDAKLLADAMEKLSNDNKELLILCRFQELKYKEVATILGINEGTVRVRMHRALSEFKGHYLQLAKE